MTHDIPDAFGHWEKFLNPAVLKSNLITASLFLAAFETLRNSIIEHLRGFYTTGFNKSSGEIISPNYETKVLSRHKSPLRASLLWFQEMNVVDDSDIALVDRIREHRNALAHDLPRFISSTDSEINVELIGSTFELVTKIDRWWVREVEIPINPDFDDQNVDAIDDSKIASGNMMFLHLMVQIATGADEDAIQFFNQFAQTAHNERAAKSSTVSLIIA